MIYVHISAHIHITCRERNRLVCALFVSFHQAIGSSGVIMADHFAYLSRVTFLFVLFHLKGSRGGVGMLDYFPKLVGRNVHVRVHEAGRLKHDGQCERMCV